MTRACGIRLGPRRYEMVVLDGGPKKHRITAFKSGEFDPAAPDPFAERVAVLKKASKELGIPRDHVGLVIDSGHAAFRRQHLPFTDRAKIEQVLKYEVENQLPQWSIDDIVVDYHVLSQRGTSSTDLLVTAVPKDDVQDALDVCERAGIEPFEAELETSAMVNAAYVAEICSADDAQLLVHVGDHSTSVVVMDGGTVREMRVIHNGALTHEVPAPPKPEGEAGEGDQPAGGGEPAVPEPPPVDPIAASRRVDQAIKRIRRELGRTISGARTANPIEAVYVCGMELPGLVGSTVLEVPVYVLDCFEEDSGQPADGFGALVVAYGSAVRELGGGLLKPHLRREELRYSGAWERVEFPLAVACLLLVTMLGVICILQRRELLFQDLNGIRFWLKSSNNFMIGDPAAGKRGNLLPVPDDIKNFAAQFADGVEEEPDVEPLSALRRTDALLDAKIRELQRELGEDASIEQPQSAFVATHLVLAVLDQHKDEWRPSIHKIQATTQPERSNTPEHVKVTLDIVFLAEDSVQASQHYENFRDAVSSQYWFRDMPLRSSEPLEEDKGIFVPGLPISVDVASYYRKLEEEAQGVKG